MRWFSKPKPKSGDRRIRVFFLLVPKRIGLEWRWLENGYILQEYQSGYWTASGHWENKEFLSKWHAARLHVDDGVPIV